MSMRGSYPINYIEGKYIVRALMKIKDPTSWEKVSRVMYSKMSTNNKLLKVIIPGIVGASTAQEFFFVTEELSKLAPMETYIKLALAKKDRKLKELLPNTIAGLYGLGYSLPAFCEKEEEFVAACYIFNVLGSIQDSLPRSEIVANSMITLFDKATKMGGDVSIPRMIRRSPAYQSMRDTQYSEYAEIENYKKDNGDGEEE